jgi:hypothetical protein
VGRITDSLRTPVSGADVSLRGTTFHASSSDSGLYRLQMPAGLHYVTIRHVGFRVIEDSVRVEEGGTTTRDFMFSTRLTVLDTFVVTRPLSANMRSFENRRKLRQGTFITSADLRDMDERPFRSLLSKRLPGVLFISYRSGTYLSSSRGIGAMDRRASLRAFPRDPRSPTGCWVQIYLDGTRMYSPNGMADATNMNEFLTRDLEAIEFYAGGGTTPPEFSTSWSSCGTLVLWTRLP